MRRHPASTGAARRSAGFALLIVLWTLVLIAFLVLHLTASGRTEIRIADNLVANGVTAAAADGAISQAIFNLSAAQPDQRWPIGGPPRSLIIGDCQVTVRLEDETARINPSLASPVLLEALLRAVGVEPEAAQRLAGSIVDWVGSSPSPKTIDALAAEYRAAGLDYAPPGAPVETLGELTRVIGITPKIYATLEPHLTRFGPSEPNPTDADPVVAAALARLPPPARASPPAGQAQQGLQTIRVIAGATGPDRARARRVAVVRFGPSLPQRYTVLAWGNTVD